ncbi:MAG: hypothetical protein MUC63_00785 [Planctomycetes bacterium]|nr:hypothetical protein [Planctomycetota bacterium]
MFEGRKFRKTASEEIERLARAAAAGDRAGLLLEKGAELMGMDRADWGAEEVVLSAVLPALRGAGFSAEKDLAEIEADLRRLLGKGKVFDSDPNWNLGTFYGRAKIKDRFLALRNPPRTGSLPETEEERFLRGEREALAAALAGAPPAKALRLLLETGIRALAEDRADWGAERLLGEEVWPRLRALPGFDGGRLAAAERRLADLGPTPGSFLSGDEGWRAGTRRLRARLRAKLVELRSHGLVEPVP